MSDFMTKLYASRRLEDTMDLASKLAPVMNALDAWASSWTLACATPDPDDLPEEAALFEAYKKLVEK